MDGRTRCCARRGRSARNRRRLRAAARRRRGPPGDRQEPLEGFDVSVAIGPLTPRMRQALARPRRCDGRRVRSARWFATTRCRGLRAGWVRREVDAPRSYLNGSSKTKGSRRKARARAATSTPRVLRVRHRRPLRRGEAPPESSGRDLRRLHRGRVAGRLSGLGGESARSCSKN